MTKKTQIQHEEECLARGSDRFFASQEKLRDKNRFATTSGALALIRGYVETTADILEKSLVTKRRTAYAGIVQRAAQRVDNKGKVFEDWGAVAYIGLNAVFNSQAKGMSNTVASIVSVIATQLEADLKCRMFETVEPGLYKKTLQTLAEANVGAYHHKQRILMAKFNTFSIEWEPWCQTTRVQIGIRVLNACVVAMSEVFYCTTIRRKNRVYRMIEITQTGQDWLDECERLNGLLKPIVEPCIEPPLDWDVNPDGSVTGGYHTTKFRELAPFIKAYNPLHKEWIKDKAPIAHIQAINKMQQTAWQINREVYDIQSDMFKKGLGVGLPNSVPDLPPDFPAHLQKDKSLWSETDREDFGTWKYAKKTILTANTSERGRTTAYVSISSTARSYYDQDKFYYVYTCDFRGRIYCATYGLSPQSSDIAKGLLRFGDGVRLGETGVKWLAIHGANKFGIDKVSFDERVRWIDSNARRIKATADDPAGMRSWWADADKPWQFLAFCLEWVGCNFGKDIEYLSKLPVGLDGSCNGLQHYAALLRDPIGAAATNLIDADSPNDVYTEVADKCEERLRQLGSREAEIWLNAGINRKLAKRPVMTLPYGATQQSCRTYIYEYMQDNRSKFPVEDKALWPLAIYLSPIMWASISEVVVSARSAMDWLQQLSVPIINKSEACISWLSPVDFPVFQRYVIQKEYRVRTQLMGGMRINTLGEPIGINRRAQKSGIAPNFIHSVDASHMVMTINNTDLPAYAMIHDDYGTHAGNTEALYKGIRQSFVQLYTEHDPLLEWYNQQGRLESKMPYPEQGTFDINDVLTSKYFFS